MPYWNIFFLNLLLLTESDVTFSHALCFYSLQLFFWKCGLFLGVRIVPILRSFSKHSRDYCFDAHVLCWLQTFLHQLWRKCYIYLHIGFFSLKIICAHFLLLRCDETHKYYGDPKNGGTCYCESRFNSELFGDWFLCISFIVFVLQMNWPQIISSNSIYQKRGTSTSLGSISWTHQRV